MAEASGEKRGAAVSAAPAAQEQRKKAPRPPPGISGTVASLVISPEWFAAKESANQRERFWWSPGKFLKIHLHLLPREISQRS